MDDISKGKKERKLTVPMFSMEWKRVMFMELEDFEKMGGILQERFQFGKLKLNIC
jgi:hypothetical protein